MINFNEEEEVFNHKFGGSERKKAFRLHDRLYMVKFPDPIREKKNELSYMNNQFSEDIGCKIFNSVGISTQKTFLGTYTNPEGKRKIVVACEDFCTNGFELMEFNKLVRMNTDIETMKPLACSIENVIDIIDHIPKISDMQKEMFKDRFWDMFVVDAYIGNGDRHLDNWGFLTKGNIIKEAPVYDCGSSLAALLSDERMVDNLKNAASFSSAEYNISSAYYYQGKRGFYHEIFKTPPNDLMQAVKRIVPRISIPEVEKIINSTPELSDVRREYLKKSLQTRYDRILLPALKKIKTKDLSPDRGRGIGR